MQAAAEQAASAPYMLAPHCAAPANTPHLRARLPLALIIAPQALEPRLAGALTILALWVEGAVYRDLLCLHG